MNKKITTAILVIITLQFYCSNNSENIEAGGSGGNGSGNGSGMCTTDSGTGNVTCPADQFESNDTLLHRSTLLLGTEYNLTIDWWADADYFRYDLAPADEECVFTLNSLTSGLALNLSSDHVYEAPIQGSSRVYTFNTAGAQTTFLFYISSNGGSGTTSVGEYSLSLNCVEILPDTNEPNNSLAAFASVPLPADFAGTIDVVGDVDVYEFTAGASDTICRVIATDESVNFTLTFLYYPDSTTTANSVFNSTYSTNSATYDATVTGGQSFALEVTDRWNGSTGNYQLWVECAPTVNDLTR